jgi:hypothetical protein
MILSNISCEWPECNARSTETHEGLGFVGWGHIRGFKIDGEQRDFHLCPMHLMIVGELIKQVKVKEKTNGLD